MCGPQHKYKQASAVKPRAGRARPLHTYLRQIAQKTFHSPALPM